MDLSLSSMKKLSDMKGILIVGFFLLMFAGSTTASVSKFSYNSPSKGEVFNTGKTVKFSVSISATQGNVTFYEAKCSSCTPGGVLKKFSIASTSTTLSYSTSFSNYGTYSWYAYYHGKDGTSKSLPIRTFKEKTDAQMTSVSLTNPSSGESFSFSKSSIDYKGSIQGQPGTLNVFATTCSSGSKSDNKVGSYSYGGSSTATYSYTKSGYLPCYGSFKYYANYRGNDGSQKFISGYSFNIQSDAAASSFIRNSPNNGELFVRNPPTHINYDVGVNGPTGTLNLIQGGSQLDSFTHSCSSGSSCKTTYSKSIYEGSTGTYHWKLKYKGQDGSSTTSSSWPFYIHTDAQETSIQLNQPSAGQTLNTRRDTFNYTVNGYAGTVNLFINGSKVSSKNYGGGQQSTTFHTTKILDNGRHKWHIQYVGNDGSSKTSKTNYFTVNGTTDAGYAQINRDRPKNGRTYLGLNLYQKYNGTISNINNSTIGTGTLYLISDTCSQSYGLNKTLLHYNGGSPSTFSYRKEWGCAKKFNWYLQYKGNDGSSKTTSTRSFTIKSYAEQTSISRNTPLNNSYHKSGSINFKYTVDGRPGTIYDNLDGAFMYTHNYKGNGSLSYYDSYNVPPGNHSWTIRYNGNDGSSKTLAPRYFHVQWPTKFKLIKPSNNTDITTLYPITVNYKFNVTGEPGTVKLLRDSKVIKTYSKGEGTQTFKYSENFSSEKTHNWTVKYIRNRDNKVFQSNTSYFKTRKKLIGNVNISSPKNGKQYVQGYHIPWRYNVSTNKPGTLYLYINHKIAQQHTITKGSYSYKYNESFNPGAYTTHLVFNSSDGYSTMKTNTTTFTVRAFTPFKNITLGINSSSHKPFLKAKLNPLFTIIGHNNPQGQTRIFNQTEWLLTNFTLPYNSTPKVYTSLNGNTTYTFKTLANISYTNLSENLNKQNDVNQQFIHQSVNITNIHSNGTIIGKIIYPHLKGIISKSGSYVRSNDVGITKSMNTQMNYKVDQIQNNYTDKIPSRIRAETPTNISLNAVWKNIGRYVSYKDIDNSYQLNPDLQTYKSTFINGKNFTNTSLVTLSGTNLSINWNQSIKPQKSITIQTNYTQTPVHINRGVKSQQSFSVPGPIRIRYPITIVNNNVDSYNKVNTSISIPPHSNNIIILGRNGGNVPSNYNANTGGLSFNGENIGAKSSKTYAVLFNIPKLKVSKNTLNKTINTSKYSITNYNITNPTNIDLSNLKANIQLSSPRNKVIKRNIYAGNTRVTFNNKYNVIFGDNSAQFTIPTLKANGERSFTIRSSLGHPIKIQRKNVVENNPVTVSSNINWRSDVRFTNTNAFPVTYTYKLDIPLRSSSIFTTSNSLSNNLNKEFDNSGTYVPLQVKMPANSNVTQSVSFTTPTIKAVPHKQNITAYWVNNKTEANYNISFINPLSLNIPKAQYTTNIQAGSHLTASLANGTIIDRQSNVQGEYTFSVPNIPANGQKNVDLKYTIPVAKTSYVGQRNISDGNILSVWKIKSESPVSRPNAKFLSNISCVQAQKAYTIPSNINKSIQCKNKKAVIDLGTLPTNTQYKIGIEHKPYNPIIKSGRKVISYLAANLFLVSGIVTIFLVIGSVILYYLNGDLKIPSNIPLIGKKLKPSRNKS